jgi:Cu/Ag efflux pump CusA
VPVPSFGGAFLPDLKEGHFILHMATAPGTSLQETRRDVAAEPQGLLQGGARGGRHVQDEVPLLEVGQEVTAGLKAIPEVRAVAQQVGRAEAGYDLGGTHESG